MSRFLIHAFLVALAFAVSAFLTTLTQAQESGGTDAEPVNPSVTSAEKTSSNSDPEVAAEPEPVPEPQPAPEPNNTDSGKPKPNGRVFKPSEEISEDSPVPFPVDI